MADKADKRILIVDDISVIRGFVKSALSELKVTFAEASDGRQALEMHGTVPADLIICDIGMPNVGGEDVVKALREKGDVTPVIILTADAEKDMIGRFVQLGIQGYVIKPFKPGVLADRVSELLAGVAPRPAPAPFPDTPPGAASDGVTDASATPDESAQTG